MRKISILLGVLLSLCAAALIVDACGVPFVVSPWKILLGVILLFCTGWLWAKLHIAMSFFPLGFLLMVFEAEIAKIAGLESDFVSNWLVLGVSALLWLATLLIFEKPLNLARRKIRKKRKKAKSPHAQSARINVDFEDKTNEEKEAEDSDPEEINGCDGSIFECCLSSKSFFIDATNFTYASVSCDKGNVELMFRNTDSYTGGGTLEVTNSLGNTEIYIPHNWDVNYSVSTELGSEEVPQNPDLEEGAEPRPVINITGTNRLGNLDIIRK